MNGRIHALPDGAALARNLHVMPGVGMAAHVLQLRGLEILRMRVDQPALIFVDKGIKTVRAEHNVALRALPGQAIVLGGNQTVDFNNAVPDGVHYEARWLLFDAALLDEPYYVARAAQIAHAGRRPVSSHLLAKVSDHLRYAFANACRALIPGGAIPEPVARQRMLEVMHWLLEDGVVLRSAPVNPGVSIKVRALIAGRLDCDWTTDRVAGELALSEASLRRRLAEEGLSLSQLLIDTRMATALTLLQATTQSVSAIALAVGYESASRFAVRFRQRFGFAPMDVRRKERAN